MDHPTPEITPQQQKVLETLTGSEKALSAYDILEASGIKSPPTVYRALDKLVAQGLIHRIESLNAYIACCQHSHSDCSHDHDHGHHHNHVSQFAICTSCGKVQEIENEALGRAIIAASQPFLASVNKKVFEITGTCANCTANP